MNDFQFYSLFNSISVTAGQQESDDERLSAMELFNPIALRTAKTPQSFGRSECNRVIIVKISPSLGFENHLISRPGLNLLS